MNFNYNLSEKVKTFIEDAKIEEIGIGCSDSQVFKIEKSIRRNYGEEYIQQFYDELNIIY